MWNLLFYLTISLAEEAKTAPAPERGTIGFAIPSFSIGKGGICYCIFFFVECLLFISFALFPKKHLEGFQTQAVIFQGMLIGVDHVLSTFVLGLVEAPFFWVALFTSPVAAILSVNDKFKNLFLCMINAYGVTYLLTIVIRLSLITSAILGIVLYFVFLLLMKNYSLLETVIGKIVTVTLSSIALVDVWGYLSIMRPLHGATVGATSLVLAGVIAFCILGVVSAIVILPTYYLEWTTMKLAKEGLAQPPEEAS